MDAAELAPVTRLHAVTFGPQADTSHQPVPSPCDGTFVCPCSDCEIERRQAVARGVRPRTAQPWHPRDLKRAA